MNRLVLLLAVGMVAATGCTTQYVMKLSNGSTITTPGKPKLKGTYYHFKDAKGQDNMVPQSRVVLIQPASMAAEEKKKFEAQTAYPKPKTHWWQFWR